MYDNINGMYIITFICIVIANSATSRCICICEASEAICRRPNNIYILKNLQYSRTKNSTHQHNVSSQKIPQWLNNTYAYFFPAAYTCITFNTFYVLLI